jgi:predicted nucleic acid-binding protein
MPNEKNMSSTAKIFTTNRSQAVRLPLEVLGIYLSDFDMMIADHAVALKATLVCRDKAFATVPKQRLMLGVW